jgi:plasmid stabilization system protein ParE
MSLPVVLTPEAQADYDEAYDWYESRQPGQGDIFAAKVQDVLDRIAANPRMHAKVFQEVRKATVTKRPYIVLYIPEATRVTVISVFHTSRDPSVWQGRV